MDSRNLIHLIQTFVLIFTYHDVVALAWFIVNSAKKDDGFILIVVACSSYPCRQKNSSSPSSVVNIFLKTFEK
jgi:hypothetical protein